MWHLVIGFKSEWTKNNCDRLCSQYRVGIHVDGLNRLPWARLSPLATAAALHWNDDVMLTAWFDGQRRLQPRVEIFYNFVHNSYTFTLDHANGVEGRGG